MILDVVVHNSDDGFTAEIPSLKGCESWAHDEDSALDNVMELAAFYLKTDVKNFKLDKARGNKKKTIYKLVFDKNP